MYLGIQDKLQRNGLSSVCFLGQGKSLNGRSNTWINKEKPKDTSERDTESGGANENVLRIKTRMTYGQNENLHTGRNA